MIGESAPAQRCRPRLEQRLGRPRLRSAAPIRLDDAARGMGRGVPLDRAASGCRGAGCPAHSRSLSVPSVSNRTPFGVGNENLPCFQHFDEVAALRASVEIIPERRVARDDNPLAPSRSSGIVDG
jgi:hypothetical protein